MLLLLLKSVEFDIKVLSIFLPYLHANISYYVFERRVRYKLETDVFFPPFNVNHQVSRREARNQVWCSFFTSILETGNYTNKEKIALRKWEKIFNTHFLSTFNNSLPFSVILQQLFSESQGAIGSFFLAFPQNLTKLWCHFDHDQVLHGRLGLYSVS